MSGTESEINEKTNQTRKVLSRSHELSDLNGTVINYTMIAVISYESWQL